MEGQEDIETSTQLTSEQLGLPTTGDALPVYGKPGALNQRSAKGSPPPPSQKNEGKDLQCRESGGEQPC